MLAIAPDVTRLAEAKTDTNTEVRVVTPVAPPQKVTPVAAPGSVGFRTLTFLLIIQS